MESGKHGLSMVEIAVGVIILALVMIPAFNVISGETKAVVSTKDHNQAVFLAQQILEKARTFPFDSLDMDRPGLTDKEKQETLEYIMKNKADQNSFNINDIPYTVKNFDIKEVGSKFAANPNAKKSLALIAFEIEFQGKDKKKHVLEFHSAISQQD